MDNNLPDCLVLKIEEQVIDTKQIDMTIYVLYDQKEKQYIIRGKRSDEKKESYAFAFNCKCSEELQEFITFIIFKKNLWCYSLYNYDNLPADSNDITYDFLNTHDSIIYELVSYEPDYLNLSKLKTYLRILKNVFNCCN